MDVANIRKRLSSYVTGGGYLKNVSDDLLFEVLSCWEDWKGTSPEFYRSIGYTSSQIGALLGKAKRMKREGLFGSSEFKQVTLDLPQTVQDMPGQQCSAVEIVWKDGHVIRFSGVDYLLEFLKKSAA